MKLLVASFIVALAGPTAAVAQDRCPTLMLSGPSKPVAAGQPIVLRAKVTPPGPYGYGWSLSAGTLVSGQYTPTITVKAPPATAVTATVEVVGLPKDCGSSASVSAQTAAPARRAKPAR